FYKCIIPVHASKRFGIRLFLDLPPNASADTAHGYHGSVNQWRRCMGLDIYAGPLTRYYAGDWQTVVQRYGAEQGLEVHVVRPGQTPFPSRPAGLLGRIFAKLGLRSDPPPDSPDRPDNAEVQQLVCAWRDAILLSLGEHL